MFNDLYISKVVFLNKMHCALPLCNLYLSTRKGFNLVCCHKVIEHTMLCGYVVYMRICHRDLHFYCMLKSEYVKGLYRHNEKNCCSISRLQDVKCIKKTVIQFKTKIVMLTVVMHRHT